MNLQIPRKTIKEAIMGHTCQALKHLVNEWQGKMIFPSCLVQPPIVNVDSPAVLHSCGNKLTPLIFYYYEACLLRNHLNWTHPQAVKNGINDFGL